MRLLIAEDDAALSSFLRRGLSQDPLEQVEVEIAADGELAIESFLRQEPDLLLLDLDLPGCSGLEVLELVRRMSPLCPVLVLSGRAETQTRIACLELGADDCMLKPFSLAELRARCRGLLRRRQAVRDLAARVGAAWSDDQMGGMGQDSDGTPVDDACTLRLGELRMLRLERQVDMAGAPVHLTNREFGLLEQLLLASGAPVSRAALRQAVWGGKAVEGNVLDVHMAALRRKLCRDARQAPAAGEMSMQAETTIETRIETLRGAGFRLVSGIPPAVFDPRAGATT